MKCSVQLLNKVLNHKNIPEEKNKKLYQLIFRFALASKLFLDSDPRKYYNNFDLKRLQTFKGICCRKGLVCRTWVRG